MRHPSLLVFLLPLAWMPTLQTTDPVAADIQIVVKQGTGTSAGRAAWTRLAASGPEVLPALLEAMDTPDTVSANWLRTAFDRIVERQLRAGGKGLSADVLLSFVKDAKRQGRVRRLALDVVEQLRPGTSDGLFPGWLNDPEFRSEAIELTVKQAEALAKKGAKEHALASYRKAFEATRDIPQGRLAAVPLHKLGSKVSIAEHLGFLLDWYVIGPFDAMGQKGFQTAYPPQEKIDLKGEYQGQSGKVRWKRYRVREPELTAKGPHVALVDLRDSSALGNADDAVGYAYTEFTIPRAMEAEFRGAADDNFTVWVNGIKVFAFEEYMNGVRFDRHRFKVKLKAGKNTVLVKVCQAPANSEPNWEFLLRVVDETGKGIGFQNALPGMKD
jgi:hypothetical protein